MLTHGGSVPPAHCQDRVAEFAALKENKKDLPAFFQHPLFK
jgi:hypothetical protein